MQIIYVNTRGYIHKYHPTLLSIELLLQLQTTVTIVLRLYRSYFDNYLSELAFSSYFTIYSKMATTTTTTTRTLHLFEHIELLSQLKTLIYNRLMTLISLSLFLSLGRCKHKLLLEFQVTIRITSEKGLNYPNLTTWPFSLFYYMSNCWQDSWRIR